MGITAILVTVSLSTAALVDVLSPPVTWTVMIHMDGDNSLEPYTFTDMDETEAVEPSDESILGA